MSAASAPSESRPVIDTRFCRFCKGRETRRETLFHPCRCEGAKKFSHEKCLKNAVRSANTPNCPDCGHRIDFDIVYGQQEMFVDVGQLGVDTVKKAVPLILFTLATILYVLGCIFLWSIAIPHFFGEGSLFTGILTFLSLVTTVCAVLHILELDLPSWVSLTSFCNLTKVEPRGYGPILFKTEQFSLILDWQRLSIRILQLLKLIGIQLFLFAFMTPILAAATRLFVVRLPTDLWLVVNTTNLTEGQDYGVVALNEFLGHLLLFAAVLVSVSFGVPHKTSVWMVMVRFVKLVSVFLFFPWFAGHVIHMYIAEYHNRVTFFESGLQRFYSHAVIGYFYYWLELRVVKYCIAKITERDIVDVSAEIDETVFRPSFKSPKEFCVLVAFLLLIPSATTISPCLYRHHFMQYIYGDNAALNSIKDLDSPNPWVLATISIIILSLTYLSPVFDYACIAVKTLTSFSCFENCLKIYVTGLRFIIFIHSTMFMFGVLWTVPEIAYRWLFDPTLQPALSHGFLIFIGALLIINLANARFFFDRYRTDLANFAKFMAILFPTVIVIPSIFFFYFRIVFHRETTPKIPHIEDLASAWYIGVFTWIAVATNSLAFEKSFFVQMKEDFLNRRTKFWDLLKALRLVMVASTGVLIASYGFENIFAPIMHEGGLRSSYHHLLFWIGLFTYFYVVPCVKKSLEFARQKNRQVISVAPKNCYHEV
ncbi:hypothetical protein QR680_011235 [Steinernema hermaphroditum]|uniref:RING-CH-type domain-containing protein n=1 Tax=Steinernema hermaphroditum TaxID=289476 RepID=A0AA39IST1_9BILA|nr:hypothetical protein QR680_011235 [Steinernema hermaphroditum]